MSIMRMVDGGMSMGLVSVVEALVIIRGNLGSKMGLIRKCVTNKFCELEFNNQ